MPLPAVRAMLSAGYGVAGQKASGKGYRPGSYRRTSPYPAKPAAWRFDPSSLCCHFSLATRRRFRLPALKTHPENTPDYSKNHYCKITQKRASSHPVRALDLIGPRGAITPQIGGVLMPVIDKQKRLASSCRGDNSNTRIYLRSVSNTQYLSYSIHRVGKIAVINENLGKR